LALRRSGAFSQAKDRHLRNLRDREAGLRLLFLHYLLRVL
jgi:hypothetical protein